MGSILGHGNLSDSNEYGEFSIPDPNFTLKSMFDNLGLGPLVNGGDALETDPIQLGTQLPGRNERANKQREVENYLIDLLKQHDDEVHEESAEHAMQDARHAVVSAKRAKAQRDQPHGFTHYPKGWIFKATKGAFKHLNEKAAADACDAKEICKGYYYSRDENKWHLLLNNQADGSTWQKCDNPDDEGCSSPDAEVVKTKPAKKPQVQDEGPTGGNGKKKKKKKKRKPSLGPPGNEPVNAETDCQDADDDAPGDYGDCDPEHQHCEEPEYRYARDGGEYTHKQFICYFGEKDGQEEWDKAVSDKRQGAADPEWDGEPHTVEEFLIKYGENWVQDEHGDWQVEGVLKFRESPHVVIPPGPIPPPPPKHGEKDTPDYLRNMINHKKWVWEPGEDGGNGMDADLEIFDMKKQNEAQALLESHNFPENMPGVPPENDGNQIWRCVPMDEIRAQESEDYGVVKKEGGEYGMDGVDERDQVLSPRGPMPEFGIKGLKHAYRQILGVRGDKDGDQWWVMTANGAPARSVRKNLKQEQGPLAKVEPGGGSYMFCHSGEQNWDVPVHSPGLFEIEKRVSSFLATSLLQKRSSHFLSVAELDTPLVKRTSGFLANAGPVKSVSDA